MIHFLFFEVNKEVHVIKHRTWMDACVTSGIYTDGNCPKLFVTYKYIPLIVDRYPCMHKHIAYRSVPIELRGYA